MHLGSEYEALINICEIPDKLFLGLSGVRLKCYAIVSSWGSLILV